MIDGTEKLGVLAARLMDDIAEEELPDGVHNARVGTVALVVEIEADSEDNEHGVNRIMYRCSDTRAWVQAGLLVAASDAARDWGEALDEED